jgi:flagellar biosynthetic protein FliQ
MPLYLALLHQAFIVELAAVTPTILILLAISLVTAIFQSAFQIEDATFSLLPKTLAMIAIALFGGFGALQGFEALAISWIGHAGALAHRPWS